MTKIILIAGPTGSGKSDIALKLAKKINGEIINADSMQVYKQIKILSARPKNFFNIKHYLYGNISVKINFSSGIWIREVKKVIKKIIRKKKIPIFVGGTGLYFKLLTDGISNIPTTPIKIRSKVRKLNKKIGNKKFYNLLVKIDPLSEGKIMNTDTQRLVRAYEVILHTKKSIFVWQINNTQLFKKFDFIKIFINPEKKILEKITRFRLKKMFENNVIKEVKDFLKLDIDPSLPANKILGISEIKDYLNKKISLEKTFELTFIRTRQYIKRQLTWSRGHMKDWIRIYNPNFDILTKKIVNIISSS